MPIALDADFPRHLARTDRFRRGMPRTYEVTDTHVTFLRSTGPDDARLSLWRLDLEAGAEVLLVDPAALTGDEGDLPPAERARRERLRESGAGITGFSQSRTGDRIVFSVSGTLWCWDAIGLRALDTDGAVFDPRLDPTGDLIACVIDGAVQVLRFVDGEPVLRVARADATVGLADFAAAEELQRFRGHWWSPTGEHLLVEVVDERAVPVWHIADPTHPEAAPREHRYPHAGATNADCSLVLVDVRSGAEQAIRWDGLDAEYLVSVQWTLGHAPLLTLANRRQTHFTTYELALDTVALTPVLTAEGTPWIDVVPGVTARLPDGRLVHAIDDRAADAHRLAIDGVPVTPSDFQVSHVVHTGAEGIVVVGSTDPRTMGALHIAPDGSITALSDGFTYCGFASNGTVHVRTTLSGTSTDRHVDVLRGSAVIDGIRVLAEQVDMPAPQFVTLGARGLHAVVLWPQAPVDGPLPIVLSPYGGPHHLEVVAAAGSFAEDQWLADQGFCVVIADGRGTPGRGLAWEHAIAGAFASVTLQDQVDALDAVLAMFPGRLDGSRVGIRGWSYGGYLSALAMLERPDRFRAAVAGAPVTEWTLYDTAYTERYLGLPQEAADVYRENSLLHRAPRLEGALLIVHGLADDNVAAAHSLQLSGALLSAGRPHSFLPLAGVSHMTPQETVTEQLLRLQADHFRRHLGA